MDTRHLKLWISIPLFLSMITGCVTQSDVSSPRRAVVVYEKPPWASVYHPGVRYYYLPDIEVYYDLSNREFVYLDNGQWQFSYGLPPIYANYDLYGAFVISLNNSVYQPWMHHHFYIAHYPRYYYRNYYRNDMHRIRGFDEGTARPIYHDNGRRSNDYNHSDNPVNFNPTREHATPTSTSEGRSSRYSNTSTPPAPKPSENVTKPETTPSSGGRSSAYVRSPQEPHYYGSDIGKPVKVVRQMQAPKAPKIKNRSTRVSR